VSDVPPPPPPIPSPTDASGSTSGFFSSLFDTSFKSFVTPKIVRVVFIIGLVVAALYGLGIFIALASRGGGGVVLGLILGPIVFLVMTIGLRVYLEVVMLLFRIEANTRK
jgi:Domain of unknown function (DUF4282)